MQIIIKSTYEEISEESANIIRDAIERKPNLVLGLATGSSPVGTYRELIRMHEEEGLDFSKVVTFNLDEYYGLSPAHEQSYHYFMYDNLFSSININPENVHVPSGVAKDVEAHCQWYEEEIRKAGGIDVQVLGIGSDGHVAFNEPGASLASRTHLEALAEPTIQDNARFFDREEDVPRFAITMGVGTILEARHCLLLANGEKKADAVAKFVEGPITSQITASALQMHPNTTVILDEDAASKLERAEHHKWVYENKRKL
jgi:glucosamine-6-phosphate deaminase